jgi:branched-chain amino acid transport system permease protein
VLKANRLWVGLIFAVAVALPFFTGAYRLQIFIFAITYSIMALAFRLTWKVGLPRFDVAAWWGVGAYTTAMLMLKAHWSYWETIPIGIAVSVILGYFVFSISVRRGMMVFMMFGMVFALAIQQVLGTFDFFGGWGGTEALPPVTVAGHHLTSKMWIYYLGLGFLIFNLVVYYLLFKSKIGRAWDAIGSGLKLANSLGIDVVRYRVANVLVGNAFLALAGSFSVAYQAMVIPTSYSFGRSTYVMMYVLIGGFGFSLAGPIVGAVVLTVLAEVLRSAQQYEVIVTGVLTVLIIMFAPQGLLGLLQRRGLPLLRKVPVPESWTWLRRWQEPRVKPAVVSETSGPRDTTAGRM